MVQPFPRGYPLLRLGCQLMKHYRPSIEQSKDKSFHLTPNCRQPGEDIADRPEIDTVIVKRYGGIGVLGLSGPAGVSLKIQSTFSFGWLLFLSRTTTGPGNLERRVGL